MSRVCLPYKCLNLMFNFLFACQNGRTSCPVRGVTYVHTYHLSEWEFSGEDGVLDLPFPSASCCKISGAAYIAGSPHDLCGGGTWIRIQIGLAKVRTHLYSLKQVEFLDRPFG